MSPDVEAALARAADAVDGSTCAPAPAPAARSYVIGDPQTTAHRFFEVLAHHGLLAASGWLHPDVTLISAGDHFDFQGPAHVEPRTLGAEGESILAWLSAHEERQVAVLLGNHDTARVMELADFTDDSFEEARREAAPLEARRKAGERSDALTRDRSSFLARWPTLPSPEFVDRDCRTFAVS
ncbi:MAG: transcriptional regulator, partial [Myxococcota bacterium]